MEAKKVQVIQEQRPRDQLTFLEQVRHEGVQRTQQSTNKR